MVTLAEIKAEDGSSYRAFITHTLNPYGYPAKDRSGQLDLQEPPNLRALIDKCATATQAGIKPAHSFIQTNQE